MKLNELPEGSVIKGMKIIHPGTKQIVVMDSFIKKDDEYIIQYLSSRSNSSKLLKRFYAKSLNEIKIA